MDYEFPRLLGKIAAVTGATGFVGRHLVRRLAELGIHTRILARETSDPKLLGEFRMAGTEIITGDIKQAACVRELVRGSNVIFHLAALYREAKYPDSEYYEVNLEGTRRVLEASRDAGVDRVVYCSTCGVHGSIPNPPANEGEPFRPCDVYQESKLQAEKLAAECFAAGKPRGVIIRPAMIWGEEDRRILKLFRGVARRRFPIIGSGNLLTHWLYIEDLVNGLLLAADRPTAAGQTYILAGKSSQTLEDTVRTVAEIAGTKPLPLKIPFWPVFLVSAAVEKVCVALGIEPPLHRRRVEFFTKNRAYSIEKARRELGYEPCYDMKEEARRIFVWYKEHGWLD